MPPLVPAPPYTQAQAANPNFAGSGLIAQSPLQRLAFLCGQMVTNSGDPLGWWGALQTVLNTGVNL